MEDFTTEYRQNKIFNELMKKLNIKWLKNVVETYRNGQKKILMVEKKYKDTMDGLASQFEHIKTLTGIFQLVVKSCFSKENTMKNNKNDFGILLTGSL